MKVIVQPLPKSYLVFATSPNDCRHDEAEFSSFPAALTYARQLAWRHHCPLKLESAIAARIEQAGPDEIDRVLKAVQP